MDVEIGKMTHQYLDNFNMSNMCKQSHMTFLITFILDLMVIEVDTEGVLLK